MPRVDGLVAETGDRIGDNSRQLIIPVPEDNTYAHAKTLGRARRRDILQSVQLAGVFAEDAASQVDR